MMTSLSSKDLMKSLHRGNTVIKMPAMTKMKLHREVAQSSLTGPEEVAWLAVGTKSLTEEDSTGTKIDLLT